MPAQLHTPIPRLRPQAGAAVLAYGFRPFFLAAGVTAALALAVWLVDLAGGPTLPSAFPPMVWHGHEMLFGFAVAAIAGFLLTAIPNWTGRLPVQGTPLLVLVLLWLAGRLAVAFSQVIGVWPAAVIDLAFLAAMLFVVAREIVAGNNRRNLPMVAGLGLLLANALMHAEAAGVAVPEGSGRRLAISVITLLIALIGGRIVPSFTRNWLAKNRPGLPPPAPTNRFDQGALTTTVLALLAWVLLPATLLSAALLAVAAVANAVRLGRWQGWRTVADPLVVVLHVGYAWVPIGLALLAIGQASGGPPEIAALHGLTAGAMGTMTLAVMTRATLGHTGRTLHAGPGTIAVFVLVTVAAVARAVATFMPEAWTPLVWTAGLAWIAAFAGFVAIYGPMLLSPRIDGRPG